MELSLGLAKRKSVSGTLAIGAAAVIVWVVSAIYMWHFGGSWHLDLRVYRAAGRALVDHGSPFRTYFTANQLPFTYPPLALLVLTPLAFGPLGLAEGAWWALNSAALVTALYLLIPSELPLARRWAIASLLAGAATLALEPVRSNMDYGQINPLLMLLIVVDLGQSRARLRGLAIGLAAAVKLTPIVYFLFFAVRRDWRSVAQGVGAFALLSLFAWVILPNDSALYWLHEATDAARTGPVASVSNQSLYGMLHRPPFAGGGAATALWIVLSVVVVIVGVVASRCLALENRPLVESVLILSLVELLISPISWSHHWSWIAVAPIGAVSWWAISRWVSALTFAAVGTAIVAPYWWGVEGGIGGFLADNSLVLVGAILLLVSCVASVRAHVVHLSSRAGAPDRQSPRGQIGYAG